MLDSLYGKTFLILGSQLGLTWLVSLAAISIFRNLFWSQTSWVSGSIDVNGTLDLELDWEVIKPYFYSLLVVDILVFLALLFHGTSNPIIGIPLFYLWSIITGIELALCLIDVDENLGGQILGLTALITFAAGLIGAKSGIDFSFLGKGLFISLLLLIVFGLIRIFFSIPRWIQRMGALAGVVIFTGYLLYDFQRLSLLNENIASNSWSTAIRVSISIYLDIINLFLDLLDLISK
ncbi:Bax inhibitor-1 family protein [Methylotenera sp.]|uniref:Bax inhibitor-1/YccA family protein n=1 Tax=Methylotenera sp. TaxID=2051956 RepID=UPI00248A52D1|nr:Bax inhibitor-1 family protein [Methylotenera sp.]MDI1298817.1 Bax inhibitor-1 family protein [Methylotenera sp.]